MLTNLLPFGTTSLSVSCLATYLPRFFALTAYLSCRFESFVVLWKIYRSELLSAVKMAEPELLVGSGSLVVEVIDAVLVTIAPSATPKFSLAEIVSVAVLPFVNDARLKLALVADQTHATVLAVQPVKVTPAGAGSLRTTLLASYGPLLVKVTV